MSSNYQDRNRTQQDQNKQHQTRQRPSDRSHQGNQSKTDLNKNKDKNWQPSIKPLIR